MTKPGGHRGFWSQKITDEQYLRKLHSKCVANANGCLEWQGNRNWKGYGQMSYRGHMRMTHRLVYTLLIGPIPDGLFVCHTCDNPRCCTAEHLWLGSNSDNQLDASRKGRHQETKKTHCPRGHAYDAQNTYITPRGLRNCKLCARIRTRIAIGWSEREAIETPFIPPGQPTKRRYV